MSNPSPLPIFKNKRKALITGFEPFGNPRPKSNPSWEVAKTLNGQILTCDFPDKKSIEISVESVELPVEYQQIDLRLPVLHAAQQYDYVIHIGQGYPDRVAIEQRAHFSGYEKPDNAGYIPPSKTCHKRYLDPEKAGEEDWTVDTAFNVDGIVEHLKEKGYDLTRKSEDPGKYVCDYTYFTSLRESRLHSTSLGHPRKVLFIHVPTPPEPYKLDELCNLITDAITCLPKYE